MPERESTPSFVLELPLGVKPGEDRVMIGRLEAGRRLYNAVLGDALQRLGLMRQSHAWQGARSMPKGKARSEAFRACARRFGFSEYALHAVAAKHKNAAGFADRLGAHETQKIASRVWEAVEKFALGGCGRPRFKGKGRPLHSLEGKNNEAGIRWKPEVGCIEWNGLALPARLPAKAQDPYVHEALAAKIKYCRIAWRNIRGARRWFVQLVQEGPAPAKYDFLACGQIVGLDIGPSGIAIVGDKAVALERFAPSVEQPWAEIRQLQRTQDRSRRAMNPDNYDGKGRAKKGPRRWKKSERYTARQAKLADVERRLGEARKRDHGELANNILGLGNLIQTETLSYKAERAGGKLVELDTRRLRMSQYDHVTDSCEKKPLSVRWHRLGGGLTLVQRDCYSAFLAKHVEEGGHNPSRLKEGWAAAEPLLRRAGLCVDQSASGRPPAVPTVAIPSERIARQKRLGRGQTSDAVGASREPKNPLAVRL